MVAATLVVLLIGLLCISSSDADGDDIPRKLIIDGTVESISKWPFAAHLVFCIRGVDCLAEGDAEKCQCVSMCSGALISPGAVLTAAHCVQDKDQRSKGVMPRMEATDHLAVVLGADDHKSAMAENFFKVSKIANAGWSNMHQEFSNDVVLLFLSSCAPSKHQPVKVATSNEFGANAACMNVTALGWGQEALTSGGLWGTTDPDRLKATEDIVHFEESCLDSMSRALADRQKMFPITEENLGMQGAGLDELKEYVSFDRTLCLGGSTTSGLCYGDSGGPVLARAQNEWVVLGVNSFVIGTCSVYADFAARVPFYATWIAEQLAAHETCRDAKEAFLSWPVPQWQQSAADARTCHEDGVRWACPSDGTCIAWSKHCDGQDDCSKGEDEFVGCETNNFATACAAVKSKYLNVMESAKSGFWEFYNAYLPELQDYQQQGGAVPLSSHEAVSPKCKAWIDQLLPLIQQGGFSAAENAIMARCLKDAAPEPLMYEFDNNQGRYIQSAFSALKLLEACVNEVIHAQIFRANRSIIVQNFIDDVMRCGSTTTTTDIGAAHADFALGPLGSSSVAAYVAIFAYLRLF